MKFLLKCRHCGNQMLYETRNVLLADRSKLCVYCGRNFKIKTAVLKQNP